MHVCERGTTQFQTLILNTVTIDVALIFTNELTKEAFSWPFVVATSANVCKRKANEESKLGRDRHNFASANFLRIKRKSGRKPQEPAFEAP